MGFTVGTGKYRLLMVRSLLLIVVVTLSAHAQVDPGTTDRELREQAQVAHQNRDYKTAIKLGKELAKRNPKGTVDQYNLACACALDGKAIAAGKWLKKAAKNGFSDFTLATTDPDLAGVRMDPGYMEAVKLIRKNQDEGRAAFEGLASKSKPLIFVPPGQAKEMGAPLLVVLHGWGSNAEDMLSAWKETAIEFGAILVAPRAVRRAEGTKGYTWTPIDEADLIVTRAIDQVLKSHRIDRQRIVLSGFSQGGSMTYHLGLRHAERFSGLIPIAAGYSQTIHAASHVAPNQLPKIFIMVGSEDRALDGNRRAARDFEAAGISVKLNVYEGVGHALPPNHAAEFRNALQFFWPN
ncbi:MAG: dienelactone hydrolase family protein [Planctomycetes bacterium]|nr:dienelactone hydrolase family protein [Planctomycetota bacterium]